MKTAEEIKKQDYITAEELRILVPGLGKESALSIIKTTKKEMEEKGYYVPKVRPFVALTKLVKKKLGL